VEDIVGAGLDTPHSVALDLQHGKIYWTDHLNMKLQRANLDGSQVEDLITTGLIAAYGIALDTTTVEIPAISTWGMAVLALAVVAAGSIVITRSHRTWESH
jgi:hypothetical protein